MIITESELPRDWLKYYLTSTGKIWGVKRDELMEGDAQRRREMMGNSFNTPEEASLAKVKLEALHRLMPYMKNQLRIINGDPAIVTRFSMPYQDYRLLQGDIALLANTNQKIGF